METRASYVTVGAFVMFSLIGLVIGALWLAGAQFSQEFSYYRSNFVGPVTGLGPGTIVRYNGIDVGTVRDVNFDPTNPRTVIVDMQINPATPIHVDSVASLESQDFPAAKSVEIARRTSQAP